MKTNFLKYLKQQMFLMIAILGTILSSAQSPTTDTSGGSKGTSSDTGQVPVVIFGADIGGKGTSSDTGQFTTLDFPDDGVAVAELVAVDTGGKNSTGGMENTDGKTGGRGASTDTGQIYLPYNLYEGETDGNKGTGTSTGGDYASSISSSFDSDIDTDRKSTLDGLEDTGGGNGGKNTTGEIAYSDTGGKGNELGGGCIFANGCMIYIPE